MPQIPDHLNAVIADHVKPVPLRGLNSDLEISAFRIKCSTGNYECICLLSGNFNVINNDGVLVRIHSGCLTSEVFQSLRCDCAWQLEHSIECIKKSPSGIIIYLPEHEGRGHGLLQKVKSFHLMDEGLTTAEAFDILGLQQDTRDYTPAFAILFWLGITRIRLITNNPSKVDAARLAGLEIMERIPSIIQTSDPHLLDYLKSKVLQFGHLP